MQRNTCGITALIRGSLNPQLIVRPHSTRPVAAVLLINSVGYRRQQVCRPRVQPVYCFICTVCLAERVRDEGKSKARQLRWAMILLLKTSDKDGNAGQVSAQVVCRHLHCEDDAGTDIQECPTSGPSFPPSSLPPFLPRICACMTAA